MSLQSIWVEKIQRAKTLKKEWEETFKIKMARAYFEGKQNPGYPANEWITINKIYSHLMAQLPTLYSMDPYFYVKLKRSFQPDAGLVAEYDQRAKIRQAMLNYLKTEVKLKTKARMAIQDAHFAYGVAKTRYASDEQDNELAGQPIQDDDGNDLLDEATGEPLLQPETIPVNRRYVVDWINSDDLLWDEDAGPLEDSWKWVAQRLRITRDEAKKDTRYNRRVINAIQAAAEREERKGVFEAIKESGAKKDKGSEIIEFYEIYDLDNNEWLVISEDAKDPLMKPRPVPKGIERHPFSLLRFTLRDKSPYPIPPVSQGMDPQKEFNLARSRLMTHRKRFNRKYEAVIQKLDDEAELSKLESGEDGTVIRVQQLGAIAPIQDAPLDQQSYTEISLLNNDLNETLGSPDASRGVANADSATEASILDKRLEVREGDRMSMVIDFVTDIASKLDQLIEAHIDRDEAVRITGPQGEFWQTVRVEDYEAIEGEFEYSVNVGATLPRLPDIERTQWITFMSQVVIPMPHILTAPSFMKKMAEMYHIEDDAMLEELRQIGMKMMSGLMPMPGGQGGGPPGGSPESQTLGAALGLLGGNVNGGGAQI